MSYNKYNEPIPTLSSVRRKERMEQESLKNKEEKELLLKAVKYYDENYPNSKQQIEWTKPKEHIKVGKLTIQEELEKLTEKELYGIYEIFRYFHDERQMPLIPEHGIKNRILRKVGLLTPGHSYLDKLFRLYTKLDDTKREIKILEERLKFDREVFEKRLGTQPEKELVVCDICGKICKSQAGLKSHKRTHRKKE